MAKKLSDAAYILAIDTSCDDTSAAVTCGTSILSNVIASQTELHRPFGGVFPTVAKLAHAENIDRTIALALRRAQIKWEEVGAIAVTVGPGLAPALEVGISVAKILAEKYSKRLLPINHIEGHVLSVLARPAEKPSKKLIKEKLTTLSTKSKKTGERSEPQFPALSIIISGGHTEFVLVKKIGEYQILGQTLDDAAGECLDKIGRMLNLGYPAGPVIEQFAKLGDKKAYTFPLPLTQIKNYDLSFSGLKTFARNLVEKETSSQPLNKQQMYDFCASIQYAVFRHICYKLNKILQEYEIAEIWLGGGVAANMNVRKMIRESITEANRNSSKKTPLDGTPQKSTPQIIFRSPYTKRLCMDNAAMIGIVGGYNLEKGKLQDPVTIERQPRLIL